MGVGVKGGGILCPTLNLELRARPYTMPCGTGAQPNSCGGQHQSCLCSVRKHSFNTVWFPGGSLPVLLRATLCPNWTRNQPNSWTPGAGNQSTTERYPTIKVLSHKSFIGTVLLSSIQKPITWTFGHNRFKAVPSLGSPEPDPGLTTYPTQADMF